MLLCVNHHHKFSILKAEVILEFRIDCVENRKLDINNTEE